MVREVSELYTAFPRGSLLFSKLGHEMVKLLEKIHLCSLLFLPGVIKISSLLTTHLTLSGATESLYFSFLTPLVWKPLLSVRRYFRILYYISDAK